MLIFYLIDAGREYLDQLCGLLYDLLRPHIIHLIHLETLAELCFILRVEMIEEHVNNNRIALIPTCIRYSMRY